MRFEAYAMLLFSISVVGYLLGFTSPMMFYLNSHQHFSGAQTIGEPIGTNNILSGVADLLLGNGGSLIPLLVPFIAAVTISMFTGFSVMFIVPLLLLAFLCNLFVFPLSFIFTTGVPEIIKYILVTLFNLMLISALVNFIRGGI